MGKERQGFIRSALRAWAFAVLLSAGTVAVRAGAAEVALPGDRVFPESITSSRDGTLYVSSFANGGVLRVRPGQAEAEIWIRPGAYGTRSTFGVLADERSKTLWVCSNDASAFNAPGPSAVEGSFLKGFDLETGEGKISATLPGARALCNDMAVGPDGSVYVTNSFAPEILRLPPGGTKLEVFLSHPLFDPPKDGAGLDGIAFGADGNLYANTFSSGTLLRVAVEDGVAGAVTKLETSRPLSFPDGLRALEGNAFLMVEGSGSLDRVTIVGDRAAVETIRDGFIEPTGVTRVADVAFVAEGQLSRLIHAAKEPGPKLPFRVYAVPLSGR